MTGVAEDTAAEQQEAAAPESPTPEPKVTTEEMWDVVAAEAWRQDCCNGAWALKGFPVPAALKRRVRVLEVVCLMIEMIRADEDGFREWRKASLARKRGRP